MRIIGVFRSTISCFSLFIFFVGNLFSQSNIPNMEWGNVPIEQLKMTSYPPDSNATALILFDRGEVTTNENYEIVFKKHRRIKILTTAGYSFGTVKISYYSKDDMQDVSDIEGQTYYLDTLGNIIKNELKNKDIFEKRLSENYEQYSFTLPSLTPGCIIEYHYTITSTNPVFLPEWSFQTSEPTLWSDYEVTVPSIFQYAFMAQKFFPFEIDLNEQIKQTYRGPTGAQIIWTNHSHWATKNVPALRDEPYVATLEDYIIKVLFQLAQVTWPGELPRKFLESWEKVASDLMDHPKFGSQLDGYRAVRKQVEKIVEGITDTLKRIEAIYDFVRTTVSWNKEYDIVVDKNLDDVLEAKTGSSAEINLLLISMLREAGIHAQPVILSTRGNGKIKTIYPMISQFDYVIGRVIVGGVELFLDATDRLRPFNLLPYRALNHTGFLIDDKTSSWVTIEPKAKASESELAKLNLQSDGALNGTFEYRFSEYDALSQRQKMEGKKQEDFIKSLIKSETMGFTADSFEVKNKDSINLPLGINVNISSATYTQVLDSFIYMNPMTINRTLENPFKSDKRLFPIDYAYPRSNNYVFNLSIPDDYDLKEFPKDVLLRLPQNGGLYSRKSQYTGNLYQQVVKFEIGKNIFNPEDYQTLKNFYDFIVKCESEQLVLQKKIKIDPPKGRKVK